MSQSADEFSRSLFEEAKRFLELAKSSEDDIGMNAHLHAALVLGIASTEAHVNSIADDFLTRGDLNPLEISILAEKEVVLEKGHFEVTDRLKMYRLEDRIEFLCTRFASSPLDKSSPWWSEFKEGLRLRNGLIHPREFPEITVAKVEEILLAIVKLLDSIYRSIYKRAFPSATRGLDSAFEF